MVQAGVGADAALLVKLSSTVSTSSTGRRDVSGQAVLWHGKPALAQLLWATSTATARVTW